MGNVYIVAAKRTPFAKAGTDLKKTHAMDLGKHALSECFDQIGKSGSEMGRVVDEVIVGNAGTPPDAANIARVIAMRAKLPKEISAYTVHRNCASALEAVSQGFLKVKYGEADVIACGGTESMSQMPVMYNSKSLKFFEKLMKARTLGQKLPHLLKLPLGALLNPRIAVLEGLTDPFSGLNMGQTAEVLAKEFSITRQDQDEFALKSHQKAVAATEKNFFDSEIATMSVGPDYKKTLDKDVGPRKEQTIEALNKLRPYFDRKNGTVTVGNACPITDGAAMMLLVSDEGLKKLDNPQILAKIDDFAFAGCDPERMGLGPVFATAKLLKKTGTELKDFGTIELNEAFAAQVIGCFKGFESPKFCQDNFGMSSAIGEINPEIVNPNGGAIALGHPVGATGARLVMTAVYEMLDKNIDKGLATLCIGGGQGGAMSLSRVES